MLSACCFSFDLFSNTPCVPWHCAYNWRVRDPQDLPDDVPGLKRLVRQHLLEIEHLKLQLSMLRRWKFGRSREQLELEVTQGNVSGKIELAGLATAGVGFVTAQPEILATGLTLSATGGAGNIGAGVLQFSAGLLQGAGGGGFSNSGYAALSLSTGFVLARGIVGPATSGYRTVSQRAGDAFANGTSTVAGGVNDLYTSLIDSASPPTGNLSWR